MHHGPCHNYKIIVSVSSVSAAPDVPSRWGCSPAEPGSVFFRDLTTPGYDHRRSGMLSHTGRRFLLSTVLHSLTSFSLCKTFEVARVSSPLLCRQENQGGTTAARAL